jgi:hypothetical protein
MNTAALVIGILGGVAGLVSVVVAAGRWIGRRDAGEEKISAEGRAARDETRLAVKRIEETVGTLQAETKQGFERIGERMRPLLDRHAQQETVDRDLSAVTSESKENRERIIRLETKVEEIARSPRRPRARKTGG